jgi:recombination DNA repair RAD52 pathway protein
MTLTPAQNEQLLKGIHRSRVASRKGGGGKSLAYVEAYDIKAHMIRIFGFGEWSWDVLAADLVYAFGPTDGQRNHQVGYRVIGKLTIHATGATYTEAAVGMANLPDVGEAHDMAVKTGESDAFKRAAINLGDQFGLSLYNNGSVHPVVRGIVGMDMPVPDDAAPTPDVTPDDEDGDPDPASNLESDAAAEEWAARFREAMLAGNIENVVAIKLEMQAAKVGDLVFNGKTLNKIADIAAVEAGKHAVAEGLGGTEIE